MKIVLVCGGRDYNDWDHMCVVLSDLLNGDGISRIVHGDARGADRMAGAWAKLVDIPVTTYPADWVKHGKAAGPIRNQLMLDSEAIDMVVSFPGGRGTADMVKRATAKGIPVVEVSDQQTSNTV